VCGSIVRTRVTVSAQQCKCRKDEPHWMKLLEDKRAARPMPTPVSKPDPPPERIVSGKGPSPISSLSSSVPAHLQPIDSPDFDIPPLIIPPLVEQTDSGEQTGKGSDKKTGKPSRHRNRRPGRSKSGTDNSATPNETKPASGDQPAETATTGDSKANVQSPGQGQQPTEGANEKSGRKRKRRRGRRKSDPKE
jgi:hypothetical protein